MRAYTHTHTHLQAACYIHQAKYDDAESCLQEALAKVRFSHSSFLSSLIPQPAPPPTPLSSLPTPLSSLPTTRYKLPPYSPKLPPYYPI